MDLAGIFAGIATQVSGAFGGPFHPARVIDQREAVYDDGGSIIVPGQPVYRSCSVQVDSVTEPMRREGFTEGDVRFLVLAGTLAGSLDTDARIEVQAGPHAGVWMVSALERDPAGVGWNGRGRRDAQTTDSPVIRILSGGVTGSATLYAALSLHADLGGRVVGASSLTGDLSAVQQQVTSLSGAVAGAGGLSGALSTASGLIGGVAATGVAVGALMASTSLGGGVSGAGVPAGGMTVLVPLQGAAVGAGALTGTITTQARLAGGVAGAGAATGALTIGSGGASEDAATTAYVNAMTVPPTAQRRGLINDLIAGLRADGVLTKLDWLTLLAAHDAQAARLNVIAPSKVLAATNSPIFTADRGYTGDASAAHLSFGEAFNATGNQLALNGAMFGAWCNQMAGFSGSRPHIGSSQSTRTFLSPANSGNSVFRANDSASTTFDATTRLGSHTAARVDAATKKVYRNGGLLATASTSGGAVATGPAYLLRNGADYADDRLAAAWFGAALTDGEAAALHNRLNTYLTAIGAA